MARYPEGCEIYRKTPLNIESRHRGGGAYVHFPDNPDIFEKVRGRELLVTYITKDGFPESVGDDKPRFMHVEAFAEKIKLKFKTKEWVMNEFINDDSEHIITRPLKSDL